MVDESCADGGEACHREIVLIEPHTLNEPPRSLAAEMFIAVEQWNLRRGSTDATWKSGLYLGVLGLLNVLSVLSAVDPPWWTDLLIDSAPIAKYAIGAPIIGVISGLWLLIAKTESYRRLKFLPPRGIAKALVGGYGVISLAGFALALVYF